MIAQAFHGEPGKLSDIEPDMTVRMTEEDAKPLLASNSGWEKFSDENE